MEWVRNRLQNCFKQNCFKQNCFKEEHGGRPVSLLVEPHDGKFRCAPLGDCKQSPAGQWINGHEQIELALLCPDLPRCQYEPKGLAAKEANWIGLELLLVGLVTANIR